MRLRQGDKHMEELIDEIKKSLDRVIVKVKTKPNYAARGMHDQGYGKSLARLRNKGDVDI